MLEGGRGEEATAADLVAARLAGWGVGQVFGYRPPRPRRSSSPTDIPGILAGL